MLGKKRELAIDSLGHTSNTKQSLNRRVPGANMTQSNTSKLDHWVRHEFREINTELEELYFELDDPDQVTMVGDDLKEQLIRQGDGFISALLKEGNTDEGFEQGFNLLGNVGFFMAACRRHEIAQSPSSKLRPYLFASSALSLQLGASLGVVPRFASAHLETHNMAIQGKHKTFTNLPDEQLFIEYNTRGVFSFIRAAEALRHILPLGISHPVTYDLLLAARRSLIEVTENNQALFDELDPQRFFFNVRPYYKPHSVGMKEYRGANAGDFSGINTIDLLLGLCRADDAYYSQLLVDKFLFMRPEDQLVLRDCMRCTSIMDHFLASLAAGEQDQEWYQKNLAAFIKVCEAHGDTALQHHHMLIEKFIEQPAESSGLAEKTDLTASGPPLPVMLKALKRLCDLRAAVDVPDIGSRHADLSSLRSSLN